MIADRAFAVALEEPTGFSGQIGDQKVVFVVFADLPHVRPGEQPDADLAPRGARDVFRVAGRRHGVRGFGLRHREAVSASSPRAGGVEVEAEELLTDAKVIAVS